MARLDATLVFVEWKDAHAEAHGWTPLDEIDRDPAIIHSVGFHLPYAKPGHFVLAQSLDANGHVDSVLCIPVAMILGITHLGNPPLESSYPVLSD